MARAFGYDVGGNAMRKLVLLKLADNANDEGIAWPSFETIAAQCECSRRTVIRHIKKLEEDGVIAVQKRFKDNRSRSNVYRLVFGFGGDKLSPPKEGEGESGGDTESPGSDSLSPPGGDTESPRTSQPEPVKEPYIVVSDFWNEILSGLGKSKFLKWSDIRITHFNARCEDDPDRTVEWWLRLIADIPSHGMAMEANWFTLEWLIKSENNLIKFLEGNYKHALKTSGGRNGDDTDDYFNDID